MIFDSGPWSPEGHVINLSDFSGMKCYFVFNLSQIMSTWSSVTGACPLCYVSFTISLRLYMIESEIMQISARLPYMHLLVCWKSRQIIEWEVHTDVLMWSALVACSRQVQLPCVGCALHAHSACRLPEPWAHQRDSQHRLLTTNTDSAHSSTHRCTWFSRPYRNVHTGAHLLSGDAHTIHCLTLAFSFLFIVL